MNGRAPGRDARWKLTALTALLISVLLLRPLWSLIALAASLVVIAVIARAPIRRLLAQALRLELFLLGVVVLGLLRPDGVKFALHLLARGSVSALATALLLVTTSRAELLRALERAPLPGLLRTTLSLTARSLFLLREESLRLARARRARSFDGGRVAEWKAGGERVGSLFVRSTARAERIYHAMTARGWSA